MREMKPAFALDFRNDTISLLHRSGGGWQVVGAVPLDTPDLPEALNYLRSTALGLSPKGIACKLIIPNDQILYTWVHAPGPSPEERLAQVTSGLEGRTPYEVPELAFDYSGEGPDVLVAVIAKETLAEAESFAVEHRFNPVSFVAVPDSADFSGEPWFGTTAASDYLKRKGKTVERDAEAVVITKRAMAGDPKPESPPAEIPEAEPVEAPAEAPAEIENPVAAPEQPAQPEIEIPVNPAPVKPEPDLTPAPELPEPPAPEPEIAPPAPQEVPEPAPSPEPQVEVEIPEPDLPEPIAPPAPARPAPPAKPEFPVAGPPAYTPIPPAASVPAAPALDAHNDRELIARLGDTLSQPIKQPERPLPATPAPRAAAVEVEEAPMALDVQPEDAADDEPQGKNAIKAALSAQSRRVTDPTIDDDLPPVPSSAAMMAFNTRRQDGAGPASAMSIGKGGAAPALGGVDPTAARPAARPLPPQAAIKAPKTSKTSALKGMGAFVSGAAAPKRQKVELPKASISAAATLDAPRSGNPAAPARKPLTKGPGGFALREPARGKPRYLGLILTVVLLFLLAMIAAWSSYSLGAWNTGGSDAVQTAASDPALAEVPDVNDEMLADMQDPEALADGQGGRDLALADPSADPADLAALETSAAPAAADPELEAAAVPPQTTSEQAVATQTPASAADGTQDEIFLAGMDAPPSAPDPLSLPEPEARGDPLPAAQPAPPPFGTVYQFDADGTIRPTPEGIITPEGVMLRAGKPPLVPAERPEAVTAAAVAAEVAAAPASADAQPDLTATPPESTASQIFADPALAGKLPRQRPEGLVPAAPADQGSLAPASDSRFASLRPQARPSTVLAAGEAARLATSGATLTSADTSNSPLAVAISRKPAARPRDMSRAVEAAIAVAMKAPAPQPEPDPTPAPEKVASKAAIKAQPAAPEDDGEPEVQASSRKTPLKTTVAKQATFKNAINLSKVNLIGVYGTKSNRYALVRQANGRYKKVRVGDNIDGGRVAAITASEVRYQKGSRLISLAMPAG
jgi:hypothetical protein